MIQSKCVSVALTMTVGIAAGARQTNTTEHVHQSTLWPRPNVTTCLDGGQSVGVERWSTSDYVVDDLCTDTGICAAGGSCCLCPGGAACGWGMTDAKSSKENGCGVADMAPRGDESVSTSTVGWDYAGFIALSSVPSGRSSEADADFAAPAFPSLQHKHPPSPTSHRLQQHPQPKPHHFETPLATTSNLSDTGHELSVSRSIREAVRTTTLGSWDEAYNTTLRDQMNQQMAARCPTSDAMGPSGELPTSNAVGVAPDVTKPNDNIKVQISLQADECTPGRVLMVGLFRLGQLSNDKPIFVKQVLFENKLHRNYRFLNTRITFRAPRSPGEFEFRVFEDKKGGDHAGGGGGGGGGSTPKRHAHSDDHHGDGPNSSGNGGGNGYSNFTIARSNRLKVCMEYNHFIDTLRATSDKFNSAQMEGDAGAVLSALLSLLRLIDQVETVFLHGHALFGDLLDACLRLVAERAAAVRARFAPTDTIPNPMETFHGTMRNVLNAIQCNACVRELVSDELLAEIDFFQRELYCQVSGLYFPSADARRAFWQTHFGFEPLMLPPGSGLDEGENSDGDAWLRTPFVTSTLTSLLTREAEQLITDQERSMTYRQQIVDQLRSEVLATLPLQVDLNVFGSSVNDFGTSDSDLDMCLVLPSDAAAASAEFKVELLLEVAHRLETRPDLFADVDTSRLNARVPIVKFTSSETGIECDLSIENSLALRNTVLLRAYANVDRRVRVLGYTLKQFVKRRRINSAPQGTLSSYGYLLMLIHYLQSQSPPVLPVLQALPPNWDGATCPPSSPYCELSERMGDARLPSVLCSGRGGDLNATFNVETYFFDPFAAANGTDGALVAQKLEALQAFASKNKQTVGELWLGFLRYFGAEFDASREVVSIRMARPLSKEEKRRTHHWRTNTRLSIEDAFELTYDAGRVIKGSSDKYICQQFVRAYSLVKRQVEQHYGNGTRSSLEAEDGDRAWRDAERVMLAVNEKVVDVPSIHTRGLFSSQIIDHGAVSSLNE